MEEVWPIRLPDHFAPVIDAVGAAYASAVERPEVKHVALLPQEGMMRNKDFSDDFPLVVNSLRGPTEAEVLQPRSSRPQERMALAITYHLAQVIDPKGMIGRHLSVRGVEVVESGPGRQERVAHAIAGVEGLSRDLTPIVQSIAVTDRTAKGAEVRDGIGGQKAMILQPFHGQRPARARCAPLWPGRPAPSAKPVEQMHMTPPAMDRLSPPGNLPRWSLPGRGKSLSKRVIRSS
jgi:hypothetical protein